MVPMATYLSKWYTYPPVLEATQKGRMSKVYWMSLWGSGAVELELRLDS